MSSAVELDFLLSHHSPVADNIMVDPDFCIAVPPKQQTSAGHLDLCRIILAENNDAPKVLRLVRATSAGKQSGGGITSACCSLKKLFSGNAHDA
jgi:hypothetical protein